MEKLHDFLYSIVSDPKSVFAGVAITYSVLSPKPGGNQASERSPKDRRGDKTCWTKPRSCTNAAAMRIVKRRSRAKLGALVAVKQRLSGG